MKLDKISAWLTLAANAAVLAGIVFLAIEIRQNTAMMETQIHQSRAALAMAEAQSIYDSAHVPALLVKVEAGQELSSEERSGTVPSSGPSTGTSTTSCGSSTRVFWPGTSRAR